MMISDISLMDSLYLLEDYPDGHFQLLLTSTPYPGQRDFNVTVDEYLGQWLPERLESWVYKLHPISGVLAMVITFKREDDGAFDTRLFTLPQIIREETEMFPINVYMWDKLNSPPSGNTNRYDYNEWELVVVMGRSPDYINNVDAVRRPYSHKTIGKAKDGNKMRQTDVAGSLAGGHNNLHPLGALPSNVLRISPSADQNRPRAIGGSFPRQLADRFILQFTNPGDWVVDPHCGAGTTIVQALKHGRNAVGGDLSPRAVSKTIKWIQGIDHEQE